MNGIILNVGKTINDHLLSHLNLEISHNYNAERFPDYCRDAGGMDVNDHLEKRLGWLAALPILEETTFPYLKNNSIVCELGVGTGRWSRHLIPKLPAGELHLVDHARWNVKFLQKYFKQYKNVHVHLNDGRSLAFLKDSSIDLIFSGGTFIELKLGAFYLYAREFYRVLKHGGYCIFDYIDISTKEGWDLLMSGSEPDGIESGYQCFTYHSPETIDKIFSDTGFHIVKRHHIGESTFIVVRK